MTTPNLRAVVQRLRAVGAGLAVALTLIFVVGPWWRGLGQDDEARAAWVQAIGSLLALGVAIFVPWKLESVRQRTERSRNLARARVKADAIFIVCNEMIEALTAWRNIAAAEVNDWQSLVNYIPMNFQPVADASVLLSELQKDFPLFEEYAHTLLDVRHYLAQNPKKLVAARDREELLAALDQMIVITEKARAVAELSMQGKLR